MADQQNPQGGNPPPPPPESPAPKKFASLMDEAMDAYGIKQDHVLASRHADNKKSVVIVTKGGSKVTYTAGDKVKKLTDIQLTGNPPKKAEVEE